MSYLHNIAEGGTHGVTVTNVNSGGDSGDAWPTVNLNGGDIEYDNTQSAHGGMSYIFKPVASIVTELRANITADGHVHTSFYWRTPGTFTATQTICQIRPATGTGINIQVVTGPQRLRIQDAASTIKYTTTTTIANATWYRVEAEVWKGSTLTDGRIKFGVFALDNLTMLDGSVYDSLSTSTNTGTADFTNFRYGHCSSATTDTNNFHVDDVQIWSGADVVGIPQIWTDPVTPTDSKYRRWDGADWVPIGHPRIWDGTTWVAV